MQLHFFRGVELLGQICRIFIGWIDNLIGMFYSYRYFVGHKYHLLKFEPFRFLLRYFEIHILTNHCPCFFKDRSWILDWSKNDSLLEHDSVKIFQNLFLKFLKVSQKAAGDCLPTFYSYYRSKLELVWAKLDLNRISEIDTSLPWFIENWLRISNLNKHDFETNKVFFL